MSKLDNGIYPVWKHPKCLKAYNSYKSTAVQYNTSHISLEGHVYTITTTKFQPSHISE